MIYVLGDRGMLGRYVLSYLSQVFNDVKGLHKPDFDAELFRDRADTFIKEGDIVINCVGIIKRGDISRAKFVLINSAFPHIMESTCNRVGAKFIHITTDCVYDGFEGNYDENHTHTARDLYGMSKSVGEPENSTVIRTSIIGEEVDNKRSLVEWIKSRVGKEANGFTNHYWNGITCLQFAKICEKIIKENLFWKGVKHVFSPTSVTKKEMIEMISKIYNLNITVNSFETPQKCDRTLSSVRTDIKIEVPELKEQIREMKDFYDGIR